jgi:3-phytase/alkaline phosphatase D
MTKTVSNINFIGEAIFPTGTTFNDTEIGGLSAIAYDPTNNIYYALSDDRGNRADSVPARFYTVEIDLSNGSLDNNDVTFTDVTTLSQPNGNPFPSNNIDPEGISFLSSGSLYISSEGAAQANNIVNPFVNQFSLTGQQLNELTIPDKFLPIFDGNDQESGVRNNLAFESLTLTPDEKYLYTAVENALIQDGVKSSLEDESASRILQFNLTTGQPEKEYLYFTDPIPNDSNPAGGSADNGLVELLALDNTGTFLALERSFASGVGNNLRLYEVNLQGATEINEFDTLAVDPSNPNDGLYDVDAEAQKRLLLDFADLGIGLDNSEGMSFGSTLPNGNPSLIVVSDNNFSASQKTQFLAFELDLDSLPVVTASVETPSEIRFGGTNNPDPNDAPDADDPAIYVHPTDSSLSFVITSLKNGGLAVYELQGSELQKITPPNIRYNNVDLVYGFDLNGVSVDLAVFSDRANDTLAIYQIDPNTRQLSDITAPDILETIFGVDDGEATAYGLATYTSLVSGEEYVFVSQADGNQIAQLALKATASGKITAEIVRILNVPIPNGADVEDAQVEGMVVDRELGYLYLGQEGFGIWKYEAEPNGSNQGIIVDTVTDINPNGNLVADVEGLTIYYGEDGKGYLFASSQGNNRFSIYDRGGSNSYLRNFVVDEGNTIDGVEESDGADIINVSLGEQFPKGVLVVQDGSNEPQVVFQDPEDGEIQNFNTNFKYVDLEDLGTTLPLLELNTDGYDPRNPLPNSLINGVGSGDTSQNQTVLWARSTFKGDLTFEYSTDADFTTIIGTETATVTDANLPVKVTIANLTPNTTYYYKATDAAGDTARGQFITAADAGIKNGLTFGVSGDWRGELAPYPIIKNAAEENLGFFVLHGDTIYADIPSDAVKNPDGTRKNQAETLEEYRAKHSEVYSDRLGVNTLADLRAATSIFATIDDHEVINDFAGGADASTDPRFPETEGLINDTELYENGLQAFQEYNPIEDKFYGDVGDERFNGERKLYRYQNFGDDAAVMIVDTRSFRDQALEPPADFTDPAQVAQVLIDSLSLERTLLGEVQLNDLKQDLLKAQRQGITWKFVMIAEPIQNIFPGINTDAYEGYAQERTELLKFINDNQIDNVVFVAADVHTTFVNNLTYQEVPFGEQIPTKAWEITTGAVAFDQPTGEFLGELFTEGNPQQQAFYNALPIAPDPDDIVNDKDDFVKLAVNQTLLEPLGFDPLGLNNNLPQAEKLIDAQLIQGDYFVGHTYGWTKFEIDPDTQQLRVITYGIEGYSEEELLDNPDLIIDQTPQIVSEFIVNPTPPKLVSGTPGDDVFDTAFPDEKQFVGNNQILFAGSGDDYVDVTYAVGGNTIRLASGNDILFAGTDDRIDGGNGDDLFFLGSAGGNSRVTGGSGADQFWITEDDELLPANPNIIGDYKASEGDLIGFLATSLSWESRGMDWSYRQSGANTIIEAFDKDVAILNGINAITLTEGNFVFA